MRFWIMHILILGCLGISSLSFANDDHHHDEEKKPGHVRPDKGIVEVHAEKGFQLSAEAFRNFEIQSKKLMGLGPWRIPKTSVVYSGEEIHVFRLRQGYFKRVDFTFHKIDPSDLSVMSQELREGDDIVISGIGFLRIAELAAFGGVSEGHAH